VLVVAIVTSEPGQAQTQTAGGGAAPNYGPVAQTDPDAEAILRGFWYSGFDTARGDRYFFSEVTVALNGDLSRNGFVLRAHGSRDDYDLEPGNGRGYQADLMLGYRVSGSRMDSAIYVGVDYQNYRLRPDDPTAEVRGTEWGFKVAADLEALRGEEPVYYALAGEYSTAFQSYWARGRVGATLWGITFGPEAAALGDVSFGAQRIGGFAIFDLKLLPRMTPLEVSLYAGHQFVSDSSDGGPGGREGAYGGVTIGILF
jgi:hypothetical protein